MYRKTYRIRRAVRLLMGGSELRSGGVSSANTQFRLLHVSYIRKQKSERA
jgi:hypothetical protein